MRRPIWRHQIPEYLSEQSRGGHGARSRIRVQTEPYSCQLGDIYRCAERSLALLSRTFHSVPNVGGGWYHRLDTDVPGPSATAVALHSFLLFDRRPDHLADGLTFLRSRQVICDDSQLSGGWAVNTSAGRPVLEATSVVARFLGSSRLTLDKDCPSANKAYEWIVHNQNADGGWGSFRGQASRIWLTAMAIRALIELNLHDRAATAGIEWLLSSRDASNVAWGERPDASATITHTAFVLSALVDNKFTEGNRKVVSGIEQGYSWLTDNLLPASIFDDSARVETYNVAYNDTGGQVTWQNSIWHSGLPYALSALVRQPGGADGSLVAQSLRTILTSQLPDGRWPNADSAAGISVWAVWPFLDALADFMDRSPLRDDDRIWWITRESMLVTRGTDVGKSLRKLLRRSRVSVLQRLSKRYWATAILVLALLTGAGFTVSGLLAWSVFGFALVVPILLVGIQEFMVRK